MNAKDAKKLAEQNKAQAEEKRRLDKETARETDVQLLVDHFQKKIDEAVDAGRLSAKDIKFSADRFTNEVVNDAVDQIRAEGYSVAMEKHNAYNTITFKISWT